VSTQIWYTAYGSPKDVRAAEQELCANWAQIPTQRLDRSPYLLFGSPAQMAEALLERRERYGLERVSIKEDSVIRAPRPTRCVSAARCCRPRHPQPCTARPAADSEAATNRTPLQGRR
jgi:hypothetical protein